MWPELRPRPPDAAAASAERFSADAHPDKLDLTGQQCYRLAKEPFVPPVVLQAGQQLAVAKLDKEYLPIDGAVAFRKASAEWLFGDCAAAIQQRRVATCQCLGGTGGLRVMADFFRRWTPGKADTPVYISEPSPASHLRAFQSAGFCNVHRYHVVHPESGAFSLGALKEDLQAAAPHSIVVLQAGPHVPTAARSSLDDWQQLVDVLWVKQFVLLLHCTGNAAFSAVPDLEGQVARLLEASGLQFTVVLSFSHTTGLYSERVGCLLVVTASPEEAVSVNGQLKAIVRPMYSNPPAHGARIATTILADASLQREWAAQLAEMAASLSERRRALSVALQPCGGGLASRVAQQEGTGAFLGLSAQQCATLEQEHHIYVAEGGTVPLSLLDDAVVARLASALTAVLAT